MHRLRFVLPSVIPRMSRDHNSAGVRRLTHLSHHLMSSTSRSEGVSTAPTNVTTKDVADMYIYDPEDPNDMYLPNEAWSKTSMELFNQLKREAENSNGKWVKLKLKPRQGDTRLFTRGVTEHGKMFEYAIFVNKSEEKLHGVVQCGPYTEGPAGHVHGGAMATLLDIGCGILTNASGRRAVTANLSINYKVSLPLNSTVLLQSKIDHVVGRKVYSFAELKSADGSILYATATALFIEINKEAVQARK